MTFIKKIKNFITVVCAISNEEIKYGICKINKSGHLKNILEKPNFQHLLNTGFYILNKNCIPMIPKNKKYDINELIFSCIRKRKKLVFIQFLLANGKMLEIGKTIIDTLNLIINYYFKNPFFLIYF